MVRVAIEQFAPKPEDAPSGDSIATGVSGPDPNLRSAGLESSIDVAPWRAQSDCVPGPEPWFFALKDDPATAVAESWETLKAPLTPPGAVALVGGTGTGKQVLAQSLSGPLARGGVFKEVSTRSGVDADTDPEIELLGVADGVYTHVKGRRCHSDPQLERVIPGQPCVRPPILAAKGNAVGQQRKGSCSDRAL